MEEQKNQNSETPLGVGVEAEVIKPLRGKLTEFLEYNKAYAIRCFIHEWAINHYVPKYTERERMEFLERHQVSIEKNHSQSQNHPYIYTMFTIITQHIMGDTVAELLDKAIDIEMQARVL
jgi:hypothetical protein